MYEEQSLGFKKKYRLEWIPSLVRRSEYGVYILGRNPSFGATKSGTEDRQGQLDKSGNYLKKNSGASLSTGESIHPGNVLWTTSQILERSFFDSIVCTFNNNICLASDYTVQTSTKNVVYTTLAGNSITTFGQAPKKLGLKIVILKKGHFWESYCRGLEAMHFMSANKTRFLGAFFLNGFDTAPFPTVGTSTVGGSSFNLEGSKDPKTKKETYDTSVYSTDPSKDYFNGSKVPSRYKVTIDSVNFNYRADKNTMIDGDIQFTVLYDYNLAKLPLQSRFGLL